MRVAALLDPKIFEMKLLAVPAGPEQVGVALAGRDDVFVIDERNHPLLLCPDAGTIRIIVAPHAFIEQIDPGRRCARLELIHIMANLEQVAASWTAINNLQQAVLSGTAVNALKPCVIAHRLNMLSPQR